ncbi:MAG: M28 family peptidase [Mahellales bacterium]|jgi:hypothetical protein
MKAYEYLKDLCEFQHRGSATHNEQRAGEYIAQQMDRLGYKVRFQNFSAPRDRLYAYIAEIGIIVLLIGIVSLFIPNPIIPAILLILPIVMLILEVKGSLKELDFLPKYPSQNVMAYNTLDVNKKTIVVSGHYDTQKASILFSPSFAGVVPIFFNIIYACLGIIILTVILAIFLPISLNGILNAIKIPALAIIGTGIVFMLYCNHSGSYTNGANDNGTGTALAMAMADRISQDPEGYRNINTVFLFTGCEEVGSKGMKAFIKEYNERLNRDNTYFLILDNIGSGRITYLEGEGMLIYRRYDQQLKKLAKDMKEKYPDRVQVQKNLLLPTDSLPLLNLGYSTITFLGKDEKGNIANYHWHADTLDKIDSKFFNFCEDFFMEYYYKMIKEL